MHAQLAKLVPASQFFGSLFLFFFRFRHNKKKRSIYLDACGGRACGDVDVGYNLESLITALTTGSTESSKQIDSLPDQLRGTGAELAKDIRGGYIGIPGVVHKLVQLIGQTSAVGTSNVPE